MNSIITKLAGVTFDNCQENIKLYGPPAITDYELKREPHNPYDPNVISVDIGPFRFGYLPKPLAGKLAPKIDHGEKYKTEFLSLNKSPFHEPIGMTVKITEINN